MEGRKVEGVFLDTAILRNKAYEAYETARVYEIRILSRVPEALLASLGDVGSRFRATVKSLDSEKVVLMLENGYEVEAENRLAMPVKMGEELNLVLESKDPITLRVERSFSGVRGVRDLLSSLLSIDAFPLKADSLKETVENSGIVYERKVWDFLRGVLGEEELARDVKYQVLKALNEADTKGLEAVLREVVLPEELGKGVSSLLEKAEKGEKAEFFRELVFLERELDAKINDNERRADFIRETVRNLTRSLVKDLTERTALIGLKFTVNRKILDPMEKNPKTLSVFREALKSLENNRMQEFVQKLNLVGLKLTNPEELPLHRDKLVSLMRDLVRGANTFLSSKLETEDVDAISRELRKLSEERGKLSELRERLTSELPAEVKKNLTRLEGINYMQSFFIAQEGNRFVIPFRVEEGKGVLALSMKDSFRIFVKLNFEEGFLGILMEAPRRENPDYVNLMFRTDIERLRLELENSLPSLKDELSDLGLEVKRLEVVKDREESFERELAGEVGEEGVFNLRV